MSYLQLRLLDLYLSMYMTAQKVRINYEVLYAYYIKLDKNCLKPCNELHYMYV